MKRPWMVAVLAVMSSAGELAGAVSWQPERERLGDWRVTGQAELLVTEILAADDGSPFGLDGSMAGDPRIDFRADVAATFDAPDDNGDRLPDDGDYPASLALFQLRIGDTNWNQDQPASEVVIRVRGGVVVGTAFTITDTLPAHPDLVFDLPASPGTWSAIDERDGVFAGTVTGIYQLPQVLFRDGFETAPLSHSGTFMPCGRAGMVGPMLRLAGFMLILVLVVPPPAASLRPLFTPAAGFSGHSEGHGTLEMLFGRPRIFHVVSDGHLLPDGRFRLDQTVTFQGEPPRTRQWLIEQTADNEYRGTLSDAAGEVTGHTLGSRLFLRYRVKGPIVMHQTLLLMPDGETIDNRGRLTLLGIPIGRLRETITRHDP